jgi:hypothetical protein
LKVSTDLVRLLIKHSKRIHIIVDGLDECETQEDHLKYFNHVMKAKSLGLVKWFITSQKKFNRFNKPFESNHPVLNLSAPREILMEDIGTYVAERLKKDEDLECSMCKSALTLGSGRCFL